MKENRAAEQLQNQGQDQNRAREQNRREILSKLQREPSEEMLWECILAFQNVTFHTCSGLAFSYHMKQGRNGAYTKELWIDRREKSKSLVWSSVRIAYRKVLELQEKLQEKSSKERQKEARREKQLPYVERPKALGDIRGITYIYGIFQQFGLIEVPEKVKEKQGLTNLDSVVYSKHVGDEKSDSKKKETKESKTKSVEETSKSQRM